MRVLSSLRQAIEAHRSSTPAGSPLRPALAARLVCPQCRKALEHRTMELACRRCGVTYPVIRGVPVFTPIGAEVEIRPEEHQSHQPGEWIVEQFAGARQPWLHLGAGATARRYPGSVELETAIFRHTDAVGDAARLPFADSSMGGVLALNVFEHLHHPSGSADELFRVLEPGSTLFVQTAFIQPLHADPHHFYNATEKGVERWFHQFDIEEISVPENFNPLYAVAWCASELLFGLDSDAAKLVGDLTLTELSSFWRDQTQRSGEVWDAFMAMPADRQKVLAAGFQVRATRPGN